MMVMKRYVADGKAKLHKPFIYVSGKTGNICVRSLALMTNPTPCILALSFQKKVQPLPDSVSDPSSASRVSLTAAMSISFPDSSLATRAALL